MKSAPGIKLAGALAALTLSAVATPPARGLIVMDPANLSIAPTNTTAPGGAYADFGYWNNMLGAHTYLGNGYLLSAHHVGALPATINIQGNSYDRIDQRRLTDPGDPAKLTDLWVWKIGGASPLPSLPTVLPIFTDPVAGEKTLLIGDGFSRANGPTFWDITANPGDDDDVWTVVTDQGVADASGFLTAAGSEQKRWGTNLVYDADNDFEINGSLTRGYMTNFSLTSATEFEAQATNADSAGPVFVKRDGVWMLTGLMHVVSMFDGQPDSPSHPGIYSYVDPSMPGMVQSSQTGISDLSEYVDQLSAFGVTVPEPTGFAAGAVLAMGLLARRRGARRARYSSAARRCLASWNAGSSARAFWYSAFACSWRPPCSWTDPRLYDTSAGVSTARRWFTASVIRSCRASIRP